MQNKKNSGRIRLPVDDETEEVKMESNNALQRVITPELVLPIIDDVIHHLGDRIKEGERLIKNRPIQKKSNKAFWENHRAMSIFDKIRILEYHLSALKKIKNKPELILDNQ